MKYIISIFALFFTGCGGLKQSQQSNAESNDLVYKQYLQFQDYMLFGIGDKDTAIESLFKSAEAGCGERNRILIRPSSGRAKLQNKTSGWPNGIWHTSMRTNKTGNKQTIG